MHRILIVDRDEAHRADLSAELTKAGYEVLVCLDADSAAQMALRHRPDLIIVEADLPGYTGIELHECLQYATRGKDIPVIFLSATESPSNRLAARRLGACDFIRKPVNGTRLMAAIRNAPLAMMA